jgi:non-specific serine/threonine protein kinase
LYLFGAWRLEENGAPIRLGARKVESLLAYLALHPEEHAREKLASQFWGDSGDKQARDSLRTALKMLRKQLGKHLLLADRDTVQLNPTFPLWVDAREFLVDNSRFLLEEASPPGPPSDLQRISSRLELYRGEFLPVFYDEWIFPERERLRTVYVELGLAQAMELHTRGDEAGTVKAAQLVLEADPTNEPAHRQIMLCYAIGGRRIDAMKQYEDCKRILRQELDLEPSVETTALYQDIKQRVFAPQVSVTRRTNVPVQLTSFVGREKELGEIRLLLARQRLVTLTGAGGSGKTRLAIQAVSELEPEDGVWWVELAGLNDATLVAQVVANVLKVPQAPTQPIGESLIHYLASKTLLLVFDNCEHLIDACALLAETLLTSCPQIRVLATSREPLGIASEHVYHVPTLSLPGGAPLSAAHLMEHEATRLFVERALAVKFGATFDTTDVTAIGQICRELDGIPLAIELAAGQVRVLTPAEIAERLGNRLDLSASRKRTALPRQQTLRGTMDWSYQLLSETERVLFRRLAVFAGGFTLDAASTICAGEGITALPVFDTLAHLVDKSLVNVTEQAHESRYRMLETIREYALEKLVEAQEVKDMRDRHLTFFCALAEEAEPHWLSTDQVLWYDRLEREMDNLRAAFEWVLERKNSEAGLRLVAALPRLWLARSHYTEGWERSVRVLEMARYRRHDPLRVRALAALGNLHWSQGNQAAARVVLEEAIESGREIGETRAVAKALHYLGDVQLNEGDYEGARGALEESLRLWNEQGARHEMAWSLMFLGDLHAERGDYERAQEYYRASMERLREAGNLNLLSYALRRAGYASIQQGDFRRAGEFFEQSLELNLELGINQGIVGCLTAISQLVLMEGAAAKAVRLLGAGEALLKSGDSRLLARDRIQHDQCRMDARHRLDEATFDAAWAEGQSMTLEQAIQEALAITEAIRH